ACYSLEKTQFDDLAGTDGIEVASFDAWGFEYLGYNMLDELLADKTIRHAMDYCTDKEYIIEMSYGGIADVAYGPVNNAGFVYDPPADVKREFSTDKANEILDAAGYLDTDGDGIREKDGKPLSFELITASHRSSWQQATVNSLIENCAKAGIEIKWNAMEVATMWDTCYDGNPDWQMTLDGWGGTMDPGYILQLFYDWEQGGVAGVAYQNPEFDELYAQVFAATDLDERAKAIEEAQALLYEDCPYTFLCFDKVLQCINSDNWTGYKAYGNGFFDNMSNYNYLHIAPKA
ncbi:MAG: hypothetical protein IKX81_04490, partial [Firmicutes bacterium]|nr:hypothetical protein [Bacillota bacterium]